MDTPISGRCDPAFDAVRQAFADNFAERGEVGAAVCVIVDGEPMVDLVGGWADEDRTRAWRPDTIVDFYSAGKALVALVVLQLVDAGLVGLDDPDEFLARIFGVGEGIQMAAMALGSFVVSILVRLLGLGPALVAIGSALLVSMAWSTVGFRRRGGDVPPPAASVIDRLLADPVFEHLGVPALSRLGLAAVDVRLPAASAVITQGEPGGRYYLVVDGSVDVTIDGTFTRTMSAGASFGEIALLRAVPRTATVTASTDVRLLAIAREDFLQAVTGHPRSIAVASDVVRSFVADEPSSADG